MDYLQLLTKIITKGEEVSPKGERCKELMNQRLSVDEPLWSFEGVRELEKITSYMFRELAWYMSGERNAEYIEKYAKLWGQQKNKDGTLNSNYGYLVFYQRMRHPSMGFMGDSPFTWAMNSLLRDKDSRRAVITYNNGSYNFHDNRDYICTQHQAFYIRGNTLLCYVALRSSDAIFGLAYNMPWWKVVYQQMYLQLLRAYPELKTSPIEVTIYSAHLYERHWDLAKRMIDCPLVNTYNLVMDDPLPTGLTLSWYDENIKSLFRIEDGAKS